MANELQDQIRRDGIAKELEAKRLESLRENVVLPSKEERAELLRQIAEEKELQAELVSKIRPKSIPIPKGFENIKPSPTPTLPGVWQGKDATNPFRLIKGEATKKTTAGKAIIPGSYNAPEYGKVHLYAIDKNGNEVSKRNWASELGFKLAKSIMAEGGYGACLTVRVGQDEGEEKEAHKAVKVEVVDHNGLALSPQQILDINSIGAGQGLKPKHSRDFAEHTWVVEYDDGTTISCERRYPKEVDPEAENYADKVAKRDEVLANQAKDILLGGSFKVEGNESQAEKTPKVASSAMASKTYRREQFLPENLPIPEYKRVVRPVVRKGGNNGHWQVKAHQDKAYFSRG
jgi:hypothetical protein